MKDNKMALAVWLLAVSVLLLHVAVNIWSPYGFHRDEFLYIAMGDHLRFWKMDFPPFIGIIANVSRAVLGESLAAIRFLPAVAAAFLIWLSGDVARRLGGKTFAQTLAALCMFLAPVYLRPGALFQPVVFDQLWWTLGCWVIIRWKLDPEENNSRWWILLGVVMGIGLFTKFSIFFFGFGVLVGLLATRDRHLLLTRWPWIALALTLLIGSAGIVGQIVLRFPIVGVTQNLQANQFSHVSASAFLVDQLLMLGFPVAVIALVGVMVLFISKRFSSLRILGWTFLGSFAVLFFLHGKAYYIAPIYPALIGVGAVATEQVGKGGWKVALRSAVVILVLANGIVGLPFGLPIVPPQRMARYASAMGMTSAVTTNSGEVLRLPQDYADMLGWKERVETLAHVFHSLTPMQQEETIVLARNYGEAGAIDFLGLRYGLPHSVCFHGSYWLFGPGTKPGAVAISIGFDSLDLCKNWRSVTPMAHMVNKMTVPEEQDLTIYLCEDEIKTAQEVWPSLAGHY